MLPEVVFDTLSRKRYRATTLVLVNGILCAVIFYIDTLTPGEIPVSALYGIVIIIAGYQEYPYAILFWFSMACLLSAAEYYLSPQTIPRHIGIINEIISIFAISCIAIITYYNRRAYHALLASRHLAEQANAGKTRFLAAASHDLRQPLQAQVLFQEALARQNRNPRLTPLIVQMGQALAAQQQMLDSLLDISRLDAGIVEVTRSAFPLHPLLARLAQEFTMQVKQRGLTLRIVGCSALVQSDPILLERILRNLLANAIKYTVQGRILVGCRRRGRCLAVQVWDTGSGIPKDQLAAIFEEFHQLDNPARDRRRGLGLGLAIVDRLAKLLGHRITVRSTLGKGSMFEIGEIPLSHTSWSSGRQKPESLPAIDCQGEVIVVIEDDRQIQEALRLILEMSGYPVVAAGDGEEALALCRAQSRAPRVVVADYRLGHDRNGTEAIARLRSAFGEGVAGLLLTGDTSPERLKEAKASGLFLLHKPIQAETLLRAIEQAVVPSNG